MRARGFMLGGTSGRTTLAGEGLQHQDGNSHLTAMTIPNLRAYDPTFAYELAVIIRDGMRRMYVNQEDILYYLTVMNEAYAQPAMPKGVEEGILRGLYKVRGSSKKGAKARAHLFGSGAILNEALKAREILEENYKVSADVWSATSYKELYRDAIGTERVNRLNPGKRPKVPYVGRILAKETGVFVAASDYVRALPASVARWVPGRFVVLGTDGYGRSDSRTALREFFEVDARHITMAALHALVQEGQLDAKVATGAMKDMKIDPNKPDPLTA
jgi:pyruvate dehydrogenase E1 component